MEQFKPTTEQVAEGAEVAAKLEKSIIFLNDKGEFFTTENNALNSVGQKKERIAVLDFSRVKEEIDETEVEREARELAEQKAAQDKADAKAKSDDKKAKAKADAKK